MSASQLSNLPQGEPPRWFFGIPWTVIDVRKALDQAPETTDSEELRWRGLAKADKNNYPSATFYWARGDVSMTIEREVTTEDLLESLDPLTDERLVVMVLRTKSGTIPKSELDSDTSPDLDTPLATDEQVAELRRKGWTVQWYREIKESH